MSEDPEAETMRRFERAVVNLPSMQRDIFLAKCRDGRTYAEIAARTRMTRKGVQKQLARALGNIRRQMDGESLRCWERWFWRRNPAGARRPRAPAYWQNPDQTLGSVRMRTDLDHLPERQQHELERVRDILLEEFDKAIARATQPHKRGGKVYKIILFGSYARSDWVDEPENGYQSDFDLLIVVSHEDLTDIADYWYVAEDRIARDPAIGRPVNIIVHSLDEVNRALTRGEYFWVDIARDGIALYELPCHALATPKPLSSADACRMAQDYFDRWLESAERYLDTGISHSQKGWNNEAAFELHQATERLYICFLLVRTLYFPRSHNIKFLRSLAEDKEPRLVAAWPRATRQDRARFERLKRAYVEARYSASYAITREDLDLLAASITKLRDIVAAVSQERLAELRAKADA